LGYQRIAHSISWMTAMDCTCTDSDPCTSKVLAREIRLEYHRMRWLDLVMVIEGDVTKTRKVTTEGNAGCNYGGILWLASRVGESIPSTCFTPYFEGYTCGAIGTVDGTSPHCWESLAFKMIELLEVDAGHWFRNQIEKIYTSLFGDNKDQINPQIERSYDISDYAIYANLQHKYFKDYVDVQRTVGLLKKNIEWRTSAWGLEDIITFIKALLIGHRNAMPLILQDDVSQNTLWATYNIFQRIPRIKFESGHLDAFFADGISEKPQEYEPDGEPIQNEPEDGKEEELEDPILPPQLPRDASAKDYLEGILELSFLTVVEDILDGIMKHFKYGTKHVATSLAKDEERRRLGLRLQWHPHLTNHRNWGEFMLQEATDERVAYRLAEKEYLQKLCRQYQIDPDSTYVPPDHRMHLEVMPTYDFVGAGVYTECSLQHILIRQYAVHAVKTFKRGDRDQVEVLEEHIEEARCAPMASVWFVLLLLF